MPQAGRPRFSVVVPALDEEPWIEATLRAAHAALEGDCELLVVDGGSRDATAARAAALARVLETPAGRGRQLGAGARAAIGEVLVFLHADTHLAPGTAHAIDAALSDPDAVGGCCRFGVLPPPVRLDRYRLLEAGVNLRSWLMRTATGDQAIFALREAYERAGGYPDYPLFEDVTLVRRLRRLGRFAVIPAVARTSRRRWEARGFWRTVLWHWLLRAGFAVGVSPGRLGEWYGSGAGAGRRVSRDRAFR